MRADTSALEENLLLLTVIVLHTGTPAVIFIDAHKCATSKNTTTRVVTAIQRVEMHETETEGGQQFVQEKSSDTFCKAAAQSVGRSHAE